MKKTALVLGTAVALVASTFLAVPAQAFPSTTSESCDAKTISPIRGNAEHPAITQYRYVAPTPQTFNPNLGELISVEMTVTGTARMQGTVTNLTSSTHLFSPEVGGTMVAGRLGDNGSLNIGHITTRPDLSLSPHQTRAMPLNERSGTASMVYQAAHWNSLGDWRA